MTSNFLIRLAKDADRDAVFHLARDLATSFEVDRQEFDSVFDRIQREDSICLEWLSPMQRSLATFLDWTI